MSKFQIFMIFVNIAFDGHTFSKWYKFMFNITTSYKMHPISKISGGLWIKGSGINREA